MIDGKMVESKASADIGDIGTEVDGKACQKHLNLTKKGAKIDARATKNHKKMRFAFWERFGLLLGGQKRQQILNQGASFGAIFGQKSKKGFQKSMRKSMPKKT